MKIDCPHCGVHGSVDDSLAGKKLRCPGCSKVFLVAEEVLLDIDGHNLVPQEIFHDSVADEQVPTSEETGPEDMEEPETAEEDLEEELEEAEIDEEVVSDEASAMEDTELKVCSECQQSFAAELLVEIDSKLYCDLCQPDSAAEEEGLAPDEEEGEIAEEEDDFLAFPDDDDDASEEAALGSCCDECGESLHPEFLETVDGKKYCALCLPEDREGGLELTDADLQEDVEEVGLEEALETEDSFDSAQALMADDDELDDDEGFSKGTCSVCGDKYHPDFMQEIDSQLYCGMCQPEVVETVPLVSLDDEGEGDEREIDYPEEELLANDTDFTVGELVKEAWQKTKGAKGSIWGGAMVMYLILFAISLGGSFGLMQIYGESDPTMAMGVNGGLQMITAWFSMLFTGGLMLMGVRRALEQRVSWKLVFAGFSGAKILPMSIAVFLQFVLIMIGFALLVLPGIYLSVGYALTLPLILDKDLGPWEALEASRKAIHKKWWTVFGLYIVMMLLYTVSAIPLGLGLIWTVPMFFVMVGILYSRFFVSAADLEEDEGDEEEVEGEEIEELNEKCEESV